MTQTGNNLNCAWNKDKRGRGLSFFSLTCFWPHSKDRRQGHAGGFLGWKRDRNVKSPSDSVSKSWTSLSHWADGLFPLTFLLQTGPSWKICLARLRRLNWWSSFLYIFLLGVQPTVCITTELTELHRPLLIRIGECDDSWLDHQLMISAVLHSHRPLFVSHSCLQKWCHRL